MTFSAVIVAAGDGLRAGPGDPKAWRNLSGRPILRWSVEALLAAGAREIVVVVAADRVATANVALSNLSGWRAVAGGTLGSQYCAPGDIARIWVPSP